MKEIGKGVIIVFLHEFARETVKRVKPEDVQHFARETAKRVKPENVQRFARETAKRVKFPRTLPGKAQKVPLNMYATDKYLIVEACMPGIKPESLQATIKDNKLTVKGELETDQEIKPKKHRHGLLQRSIRLPVSVESDKAEAAFEDGILTLTLPKTEEVQPKLIEIKIK